MAGLFDLLDREWTQLRHDRGAARQLPEAHRAADGARSLAEVESYVRAAVPADADRVLLTLVTLAVAGDRAGTDERGSEHLAARTLLQLLLPGTRKLAGRWWALGDHDERAAAAVAAVFSRIQNYPLKRRPGRVAANVLMDAAQDLRRAVPKVPTTPYDDLSGARPRHDRGRLDDPQPTSAEELAIVLADAVTDDIVSRADAELIARSRIRGHRVADIADEMGLTARTLWDRRQRAEAELVRQAGALAVVLP